MENKPMTASEMGKKGHATRLRKYGKEYYRKLILKRWEKRKAEKTTPV